MGSLSDHRAMRLADTSQPATRNPQPVTR